MCINKVFGLTCSSKYLSVFSLTHAKTAAHRDPVTDSEIIESKRLSVLVQFQKETRDEYYPG